MTQLRRAWRAASVPGRFFEDLPDEPALGAAAAAGGVSLLMGALALGVVLARGTASDAWPLFLLGTPLMVLPYAVLVSILGSLVLMRPAGMDLRAFEIVAWAWVPSGFLAVSLLPIGWFAPWATMAGALAMLPAWHLWLVWRGTEVHATARPRAAAILYLLSVFGLPSVLVAFTLSVLSHAG
ncbi:MAG: hypothetical protein U5K81_07555 [Trueperaceae bacterium]|nr:hypothetical protein [Trueperaceae bacterium]